MKPTDWTEDRPPTRGEALLAAARALSLLDEWVPPDVLHAHSHYAEAWIALAALADPDEAPAGAEPAPEPDDPDQVDAFIGDLPQDADICEHGEMTMEGENGRYHVATMSRCYPS